VKQSLQHCAQLAAVVVVVIGCYQVLYAFIPAILFSAVACSASWPVYLRVRNAVGGRSALAALLMTLLSIILVIGPSTLLAVSLADVPGAFLLATVTFFLSMIPIGPPLVWGAAALWLFFQGSIG